MFFTVKKLSTISEPISQKVNPSVSISPQVQTHFFNYLLDITFNQFFYTSEIKAVPFPRLLLSHRPFPLALVGLLTKLPIIFQIVAVFSAVLFLSICVFGYAPYKGTMKLKSCLTKICLDFLLYQHINLQQKAF